MKSSRLIFPLLLLSLFAAGCAMKQAPTVSAPPPTAPAVVESPLVAPAPVPASAAASAVAPAAVSPVTSGIVEERVVETSPATQQPAAVAGAAAPPTALAAAPAAPPPTAAAVSAAPPTAQDLAALEAAAAAAGRELVRIHFDYDQYTLTADSQQQLTANAGLLKTRPGIKVLIEGHCDERGSDQYNIALGERRAQAAREFLITLGIDGERLTTVSYGEEKPLSAESNETAWALNRRAEFVPGQ